MSADIVERTVLLPVVGLKIEAVPGIDLGWCSIVPNSETSEMQWLLQAEDPGTIPQLEEARNAPSYIKVVVHGQAAFALQQAERYGTAALAVLQLFQGSYRSDRFVATKRQMAVLGKYSPASSAVRLSFPGATLQSGSDALIHFNIKEDVAFVLNPEVLSRMQAYGATLLCTYLGKAIKDENDDMAWRVYRAVHAFAKATTTDDIVDSFLYLAIAIEALLSEDRTPQETYARQMAALVTRGRVGMLYPMDGWVDPVFTATLRGFTDRSDAFEWVQSQVLEFFTFRNRIAHGKLKESEMGLHHLGNFETLVRNTVLSFVMGKWDSLQAFKTWMKKSVKYRFSP